MQASTAPTPASGWGDNQPSRRRQLGDRVAATAAAIALRCRQFWADTRAQTGGRLDLMAIMITVIAAGVTGYVGLSVMDTTKSSAGLNTSQPAGQRSAFENSTADLTDGIDSFFSNIGTVFTVIVLVVILSYLMLLRGR